MLKPKKLLEENMSLEAALHWFKTYKNHLDLNKAMLAQQSIGVRRGILENDIDPHMANALGAHSNVNRGGVRAVQGCKVHRQFWGTCNNQLNIRK